MSRHLIERAFTAIEKGNSVVMNTCLNGFTIQSEYDAYRLFKISVFKGDILCLQIAHNHASNFLDQKMITQLLRDTVNQNNPTEHEGHLRCIQFLSLLSKQKIQDLQTAFYDATERIGRNKSRDYLKKLIEQNGGIAKLPDYKFEYTFHPTQKNAIGMPAIIASTRTSKFDLPPYIDYYELYLQQKYPENT